MATKSKYAVVNLVCKILNLGEFAKIENFVEKTIKTLKREVKNLKRNLDTQKQLLENELEDFKDKLEDAENAVEEAYNNIDVDQLGSNEKMNKFMDKYLDRITSCEQTVEDLKQQKKKTVEQYEQEINSIDAGIKMREKRIKKLSS